MLIGCGSNTEVATITITPSAQSLAAGQAAQFSATGTIPHGKHPPTNEDVTSQVTWASNAPAIATISATGVATAVSAGTATITASMAGATSATATITVSGSTGGTSSDIVSLTVIPGAQSVAVTRQTAQFIAVGTTGAGVTQDMTNQVSWTSSSTSVATITASGLATGQGQGTTTITAIATNPDKTVATGTATFTVTAGTQEAITAIAITPDTESIGVGEGTTGQFIAIGTTGAGLTEDVTNSPQLKWISSVPSIATIASGQASGNGVAQGVSVGSTSITALWTNQDNTVVTSTPATVTVTLTTPPNPLLSLNIIPTSLTVGNLQGTGQFLAIGTFSKSPYVVDVTNSPNTTWISSFPDSFPVNTNSGGTSSASAGIVTAYGTGSATIIAEYQDPDSKTIQTATATFNCPLVIPQPSLGIAGSCYPGSEATPLKVTLTVYGEGLNTTNWLVTGPSATGTPDVIHCGPGWAADGKAGGSVCVGIYPVDTPTITLTAPAQAGVAFGGWTYNCHPVGAVTAAGPNSCTIDLSENTGGVPTNVTVGAIFNNAP
jgi:Bacterial Ig-like domain (group 2)